MNLISLDEINKAFSSFPPQLYLLLFVSYSILLMQMYVYHPNHYISIFFNNHKGGYLHVNVKLKV